MFKLLIPNNYFMVVYHYHEYYTYITSNPERSVLYTGVTNNLDIRLIEHWSNRGQAKTFAGRYYCYNLLHYEVFSYINDAINREKEIKRWSRKKKVALIKAHNPELKFLNLDFCRQWPPKIIPNRDQ